MKVEVMEWFSLKTWTYDVNKIEEDDTSFSLELSDPSNQIYPRTCYTLYQTYYKGCYSYRTYSNNIWSEKIFKEEQDEKYNLLKREECTRHYSTTF